MIFINHIYLGNRFEAGGGGTLLQYSVVEWIFNMHEVQKTKIKANII